MILTRDGELIYTGGGNINFVTPATRLTDLNSAGPRYTPGPLIPRGKLSNGKQEPVADGARCTSRP